MMRATDVLKRRLLLLAGSLSVLCVPASALHFNHDAFNFATLEELLSPGKEVKAWSDTLVRITGIGFRTQTNTTWQYQASRSLPCTLSAGETLAVKFNATFIRNAENPAVDSLIVVVNQSLAGASYVQLHIGALPHVLVTTNTITGPAADTSGKPIRFDRDSVYCTLRHGIYYEFLWDDGFKSPWLQTRTAVHSWSIPRRYNVRIIARCQLNLFTDSSKSFSLDIAPDHLNAAPGSYKSGFVTIGDAMTPRYIDFSQGADSPHDSDAVFKYINGYSFIAPAGALTLGIYDSMPTMDFAAFARVNPETSSVYRTYKATFDSIVRSLHLVCPAVMPDSGSAMNTKQMSLVRTQEGHYAILIKVGQFPGGADRQYYYWGYQSDGGRMFAPGAASVSNDKAPAWKPDAPGRLTVRRRGNATRLALPRDGLTKEIKLYKCDGSMPYHWAVATGRANSIDLMKIPRGFYLAVIRGEKEKITQRVYIHQ